MVPRQPCRAAAFRAIPHHQQDRRQPALDPGKYLDYVGRSLDRSKVGKVNQNFFPRGSERFSQMPALGGLVVSAIYKVLNHLDLVLHGEVLLSTLEGVLRN